ncbi:hypothetical protein [Pengzhenrongella frigida]|uniref:Uncharacterized protein n=1 Tax=Pengzhenrongella frigida TaxID=1259133 RepID=A0A4Q5MWG3_9MICO|nr:hypothetical protein [Cellulomonas sp. HLT2-17]RYV49910.1 hypothetical protein EUA98_16190 [Cellulomonas sp. HLT2-17]
MPTNTRSTPRPGRRTRVVFLLIAVLAVCLLVPRLREWAWVFAILIIVTPIGGALVTRFGSRR